MKTSLSSLFLTLLCGLLFGCGPAPEKQMASNIDPVEHGKYMVTIAACHDCHTPKNFTDHGPVLDSTRLLSGHPVGSPMGKIVANMIFKEHWYLAGGDLTAWAGPWGVSYTANLTPDPETGLGGWDENMFISTIRNGKHMGTGRQILPPMPWEMYRNMSDNDLKAIFAYLKSIPPIKNKVLNPLPPNF